MGPRRTRMSRYLWRRAVKSHARVLSRRLATIDIGGKARGGVWKGVTNTERAQEPKSGRDEELRTTRDRRGESCGRQQLCCCVVEARATGQRSKTTSHTKGGKGHFGEPSLWFLIWLKFEKFARHLKKAVLV